MKKYKIKMPFREFCEGTSYSEYIFKQLYFDIPALIKDGYIEEIKELKEEIIEGFQRKHVVEENTFVFSSFRNYDDYDDAEYLPAILIKNPTEQTKQLLNENWSTLRLLNGNLSTFYVSDYTRHNIINGIKNSPALQVTERPGFPHKISIFIDTNKEE